MVRGAPARAAAGLWRPSALCRIAELRCCSHNIRNHSNGWARRRQRDMHAPLALKALQRQEDFLTDAVLRTGTA
jgi:hypothetical protein